MVVGDRASTDGLLARRLETRFGLVLSGVTRPGHGALTLSPTARRPISSPSSRGAWLSRFRELLAIASSCPWTTRDICLLLQAKGYNWQYGEEETA